MPAYADTALPEDPAALAAMIVALRGELTEARASLRAAEIGLQVQTLEAEKLRAQIARLRHQQYGRSSERLTGEIEQLELRLDDVLTDLAATGSAEMSGTSRQRRGPRREAHAAAVVRCPSTYLGTTSSICPDGLRLPSCGGALRKVGDDVTEILDYIPGRFQVIRHVRPAFSCRQCESDGAGADALAPGRAAAGRDRASWPMSWSEVLRSPAAVPPIRRSMPARASISTAAMLAGWVGKAAASCPLARGLGRPCHGGRAACMPTTRQCRCSPRAGQDQDGRFWAYLRDDRPFGGSAPPAVLYRYTPDRKGEHPRGHLRASAASCRPMPMPASTRSTKAAR